MIDSFDLSSFERKNFTDALSKDRDVVGQKINPPFIWEILWIKYKEIFFSLAAIFVESIRRLNKIPLKNFTDTLSKDRDVVGQKINPPFIWEILWIKYKEIFFSLAAIFVESIRRLNKIPLKNFTDTLSKDRDVVGQKINPPFIWEILWIKYKEIFFSLAAIFVESIRRLNKIPLKNFTDTLSKDRDVVGRKINPLFM